MKVMKMKYLCQRQEFMNSLMVMTESHFSTSIHCTFFIYGILLTHMTYYIMYINNFEMTVSVMDQMPQVLLQLKNLLNPMICQLLQTTCWIISNKLLIPSMDWLELLSKVKLTNRLTSYIIIAKN